jgi:tetratricopeptide (TPR) repeat protein
MRRLLIFVVIVLTGCASPLVEQIKVDLRYDRFDDALEHGREAVAKEPNNALAHFLLGQAYIHTSQWTDAVAEVDRALELDEPLIMNDIEKDPGFYWSAYYNAGIQHVGLQEYDRALELFLRSAAIDSGNAESYNYLGYTYLMLGDEEKMMESYGKAIEIDSANAEAYFNLGLYYANRREHDQAMKYIERAESLAAPVLEEYQNGFFEFVGEPPATEEKEACISRLMAADSSVRGEILTSEFSVTDVGRGLHILGEIEERRVRIGEILSTKGLIFLNQGMQEDAEGMLLNSLSYWDDYPDTYFYLVLALQAQGKYEETFDFLDTMIDLDSSDVRGWFQRGVSYFRTGKYDEALETFGKVIELSPDDPDAYVNRGSVYVKQADLAKTRGKTAEEERLRDLATRDFQKAEELEKAQGSP